MSNRKPVSDGSRPIVGDLDRVRQYQLTSNGSHTIRIRQEAWVPWMSYLHQWNAANAYNLALVSELSYSAQDTFHSDIPIEAGKTASPGAQLDENEIADAVNALGTKSDRTKGDLDLPFLTRTVAREDGFQDLRFWDAAQFRRQSGREHLDAEALTGFYDLDTQAFAAYCPKSFLGTL